jgi:protease I
MFGKDITGPLKGKKVAILATNGFEQSELLDPKSALENAGADVEVVSLASGKIKAWDKSDWGKSITVDKNLDEVTESDYDCLMLPGGVMNPDHLRKDERAVTFSRNFLQKGKPIAAICHGPWLLIETGLLKGMRLTSYPSIKTDLRNAGADWEDQEVIVDKGVITSRGPQDLPVFISKMIEEFAEGRHLRLPNTEGYSATL